MLPRKTFQQVIAEGYQLMLPLPEPPGIRTSREYCTACDMTHRSKLDELRCRQARMQTDQPPFTRPPEYG